MTPPITLTHALQTEMDAMTSLDTRLDTLPALAASPLDLAPVLPVVVIEDPDTAVPLARALVDGGLPAIEVTLRTPLALEAVRRIASHVPEAVVGVGTVRTPAQVREARAAGARFLVSPGATPSLLGALDDSGLPYLPGVSTISEMLALVERGVREMKFFPAEAAGGRPFLRSVTGPLPDVRFCPTGGITPDTAADWLALPNVGCVGGSWLTPADAVATRDWDRIRGLASVASGLRAPARLATAPAPAPVEPAEQWSGRRGRRVL